MPNIAFDNKSSTTLPNIMDDIDNKIEKTKYNIETKMDIENLKNIEKHDINILHEKNKMLTIVIVILGIITIFDFVSILTILF